MIIRAFRLNDIEAAKPNYITLINYPKVTIPEYIARSRSSRTLSSRYKFRPIISRTTYFYFESKLRPINWQHSRWSYIPFALILLPFLTRGYVSLPHIN